jgi:hypothetical protein
VFKPTVVGAKSAGLTFTSGSGASAHAPLTGTGATPAALSIGPASQAYATRVAISAGAPETHQFTVTNTGGVPTGSLFTGFTGVSAAQYSTTADTCSGVSLGAGASCTVTVAFTPSSACNPCDANLSVSGAGAPAVATLSGIATGLTITPSSHDFGPHAPATMTNFQFTVGNTSASLTPVATPQITGTNSADYTIANNTCAALAMNATCTFDVVFNPVNISPGRSSSATVSVTPNPPTLPGGTARATLTGSQT